MSFFASKRKGIAWETEMLNAGARRGHNEMCAMLTRQLKPLDIAVVGATHASDVAHVFRRERRSKLRFCRQRFRIWNSGHYGASYVCLIQPSILVYALSTTFQLWAGVLESGVYDLIAEPFSEEKIQDAVSRASRNFKNDENRSGQETES